MFFLWLKAKQILNNVQNKLFQKFFTLCVDKLFIQNYEIGKKFEFREIMISMESDKHTVPFIAFGTASKYFLTKK